MFQFNNCKKKILQLELTVEHQQSQMNELRAIVLTLVTEINHLQKELEKFHNSTYGKSI
jgi:cell division protein FtsB